MKNSKEKGNEFERLVSGLFDDWFQVPKKTFWRTTQSGGWVEPGDIAPRQRDNAKGKIWWPFIVECKHYKDFNFLFLLKPDTKHIIKQWWWKLEEEHQKVLNENGVDKVKLLIFRKNNNPVYCAFDPFQISLDVPCFYINFLEMKVCLFADVIKKYPISELKVLCKEN
jgi:hypothetical protein